MKIIFVALNLIFFPWNWEKKFIAEKNPAEKLLSPDINHLAFLISFNFIRKYFFRIPEVIYVFNLPGSNKG
jgi:hypothetical protein